MQEIVVYRCYKCFKSLTYTKTLTGRGCRCGSRHISPTYPRLVEMPRLILEHIYYSINRRKVNE